MKQQDDLKTRTQTEVFNQALAGLSKVGVPFLSEEEASLEPSAGTASPSSWRDDLVDSILEDHPLLTREELERMMRAQGF